LNRLDQFFEFGNPGVGIDQGHVREGLALPHDSGVLENDQSGSAPGSSSIIRDVALIDISLRVGKIGRHGRHDDPVFQLQFADATGSEQFLKNRHMITSPKLYLAARVPPGLSCRTRSAIPGFRRKSGQSR